MSLPATLPGATTFWWVSTLAELESGLGGGSGSAPTVTVNFVDPRGTVTVPSNIEVAPATYSGSTFLPPVLSGGFAVPSTVAGPETVEVVLTGLLDGFPLANIATAPLLVNNPPTTTILVPTKGSRLSGTSSLDASATNPTSVQFVLFGGPYFGHLIGPATLTPYGWILNWNTKTVPNGTYLLFSQAINPSGNGVSSPVKISVHNRR